MSVSEAASYIKAQSGVSKFSLGLVLGSGWGASLQSVGEEVWSGQVAGFGSVVAGHSGSVRVLRLPSGAFAVVLPRTHLYEGHGVEAVAFGVRVATALGVGFMVFTNGCGGITYAPGTVVAIRDHINLTGHTPMVGPQFFDMSTAYDLSLVPDLPSGVYAQFAGPQYETPAEIQMAKVIGADLIGMSTALEVIAARSLGMRVLGLSLVTNWAAGLGGELSHQEVIDAGVSAADRLSSLLATVVSRMQL